MRVQGHHGYAAVPLSSDQQVQLFKTHGALVRRVFLDPSTGLASILDRSCTRCLLAEDLPGVEISATGLCNQCLEFERQAAWECDLSRAAEVMRSYKGAGEADCVVAYSGGKDSAAVLMFATTLFKLRPVALLVDNGFIPDEVKDAARGFCDRIGVALKIATFDLAPFAADSLHSTRPSLPCQRCIRTVFREAAKLCQELDTKLIITGHRFPPLSFKVDEFTGATEPSGCVSVAPLLAIKLPEKEQLDMVRAAGWRDLNIVGNTSNCQLIGYAEERFFGAYNYNPHIYEVSKEIRAGFYSRAHGVEKVTRPVLSQAHQAAVSDRLRLAQREPH